MRAVVVALCGAALFAVLAATLSLSNHGPSRAAKVRAAVKLSVVSRLQNDEAGERRTTGARTAARPPAYSFRAGLAAPAIRVRPRAPGDPTFGQPTISGIGGVGFEEDLRLDPSNGQRLYTSVPGSLSSDTSWIWRSIDGGKTFKRVLAAVPLTGKATACAGGGDTELAVDSAGHVYFNDLTLANFSTARSDDFGATFACSNSGVPDAGVDRQWYDTVGDPTAGGNIYLANDEVGPGAPVCGSSTGNNVLVMYRSPAGGAGATAGIEFGPANKVTRDNSCDEGIMGNDAISPVATTTGQIVNGNPTTLASPVRHVYVIHDDASFTKIAIGRCFPVKFGAPVPNVSDPSGLNCVDLPVANLGPSGSVKTGGNFPSLAIDRAGNLYAVWEKAVIQSGKIMNTGLFYSYSTDEGNTWSQEARIPTPGLRNNVFAWAAAGSDGRVDVAWYGTPATVDTVNGGPQGCTGGGPDSVDGSWSLYLTQTLNGHDPAGVVFTSPILASEHPIHRGSIQTVLGGQCGDRTLGDFLQVRVGKNGEAQVSYADSNNQDAAFAPHAMYVRQIGGNGVIDGKTPTGSPIMLGSAGDPTDDGIYEAGGATSPNMPNLDIVSSSLSEPAPASCHPAGTACLRARLMLNDMSLTAPAVPDTDTDLVWLTQWLVPSAPGCTSSAPSCVDGGKNFFVYAESNAGGDVQCFSGENAAQALGGGVTLTYPGTTEITASGACRVVNGPNGSITIDVPLSQVALDPGVSPLDSKLYSVTASTMTLPAAANSQPPIGGLGGVLFNVIDVVRGYDVAT